MAIRFLSLAIVFALGPAVWGVPADASEPCCNITAIDAKNQMVAAKETQTGRTFQFKVADTKRLVMLKVGEAVHADFKALTVSLTPDGVTPCCAIVNLRAPASGPAR